MSSFPSVAEHDRSPGTLGEVLYATPSKPLVSEADWVDLVRSVATGNQDALHALYERTHRLVFTLSIRMTGCRETAEEVTLDVFHDVWRRAASYDEANGTVLGWIMNQARSRAIDRLRFEHRQKRTAPDRVDPQPTMQPVAADQIVALRQRSAALSVALDTLSPAERLAIETAYFGELPYADVAARLHEPVGTIKTRIRSGLHKLRAALAEGGHTS